MRRAQIEFSEADIQTRKNFSRIPHPLLGSNILLFGVIFFWDSLISRPTGKCMIVQNSAIPTSGFSIRIGAVLFAWIVVLLLPAVSIAETIRIVAIGASNTNGKGVGRSKAWPNQLQTMLKQKGYDVRVINKGVNGNTTSQVLRRLPRALGLNTQIAIVAVPLDNDRKKRVKNTNANVAKMRAILEQRGIRYVFINRPRQWAKYQFQSDRLHFSVAGHRTLATKLVSKVVPQLQ